MRKKVLLGLTDDNEVAFAEVNLSEGLDKKQNFSMSTYLVRPFRVDDIDLVNYTEDWIDGMDDGYLYTLCKRFDCKPSELAEYIANEEGIEGLMDLSIYPDFIDIDGDDFAFESGTCGQHDSRGDMLEYVNEENYNKLHEFWDEYHLKVIPKDKIAELNELLDKMVEVNSEDEIPYVQNWIKEYIL